jgi:G3E family GTPase
MKLKLKWSCQVPFKWADDDTFDVNADLNIEDIADTVEDLFEVKTKEFRGDEGYDFQVQLLVKIPEGRKALPWGDPISKHFKDDDIVGVMGQSVPHKGRRKGKDVEAGKLPVIILTGFLGSGKTTLLNYILEEQREKKIAVIENEFGEIPIDQELINQKFDLAEQVVVLDNGCMCCQVRGDLEEGLAQIQKKVVQGNKLDLIVIETTGMADPVPIAKTFKENPWITERMRYDGCITVVDAKNCLKRLALPVEADAVNEAERQISFADKVILNKTDLVNYDEAVSVKEKIAELNKFVRILPAVKGRVKLDELMDLHANDMFTFDDNGTMDEVSQDHAHGHEQHGHGHGDDSKGADFEHHGHGHGESHGHGHDCDDEDCEEHGHGQSHKNKKSRHDSRVNSIGLQIPGEMTRQSLSVLMQRLSQPPDDKGIILRIKGIFCVQGINEKVAFHAVMDCTDEEMIGGWADGEKKVCKLVVIGRNIDKAYIRESFETAVCIPGEPMHGHGHGAH